MVTEVLVSWLAEAYAMELAEQSLLEQWSKDFERHPDLRSEIRQHLVETSQHIKDIAECIESIGGTVSEAPEASTHHFIHLAEQATSTSQYNDELVKAMLALHAVEHFEHATYLALSEAARALGEDEIADTCEHIAEEEHAMAEWSEEQIPTVVAAYIANAREEV